MKQLESKQKQTIAFNPLIPHRPFPAMSFTHLADWFLSSASRQSLLAVRLFVFYLFVRAFQTQGDLILVFELEEFHWRDEGQAMTQTAPRQLSTNLTCGAQNWLSFVSR